MAAYDISDALPRLESTPLLVITSQHDYARPDGEKLYAEKKGPKAFHVIAKAGHFDLYDLGCRPIFDLSRLFAPE